jgi:hypothetical protein
MEVESMVRVQDAAALLLADGWHIVDQDSLHFAVWGYDNLAALEWTETGQVFKCPVHSVLAARWSAP